MKIRTLWVCREWIQIVSTRASNSSMSFFHGLVRDFCGDFFRIFFRASSGNSSSSSFRGCVLKFHVGPSTWVLLGDSFGSFPQEFLQKFLPWIYQAATAAWHPFGKFSWELLPKILRRLRGVFPEVLPELHVEILTRVALFRCFFEDFFWSFFVWFIQKFLQGIHETDPVMRWFFRNQIQRFHHRIQEVAVAVLSFSQFVKVFCVTNWCIFFSWQ